MTNENKLESVSLASIDTPTAELVKLFRGSLADVRFPGIDASVLETATESVTSRAAEVERLRVALAEARDGLEAEQQSLREQARRAHAYAQVYAMDNDELTNQLDAIVFDAPKARIAKKPRARRSKVKTPQLMLENDTAEQVVSHAV
jgi:hypothetical protein